MKIELEEQPGNRPLAPGKFAGIASCLNTKPAREAETPASFMRSLSLARCSRSEINRAIREMVFACHGASYARGWWHDSEGNLIDDPLMVPTKLMLIVSEIGEAMEAHRKSLMDDKLPHRPGIEVELVDALIRIFDLAGALDLDLSGAFLEKMQVNATRDDHAPESRAKTGGKTY